MHVARFGLIREVHSGWAKWYEGVPWHGVLPCHAPLRKLKGAAETDAKILAYPSNFQDNRMDELKRMQGS